MEIKQYSNIAFKINICTWSDVAGKYSRSLPLHKEIKYICLFAFSWITMTARDFKSWYEKVYELSVCIQVQKQYSGLFIITYRNNTFKTTFNETPYRGQTCWLPSFLLTNLLFSTFIVLLLCLPYLTLLNCKNKHISWRASGGTSENCHFCNFLCCLY